MLPKHCQDQSSAVLRNNVRSMCTLHRLLWSTLCNGNGNIYTSTKAKNKRTAVINNFKNINKYIIFFTIRMDVSPSVAIHASSESPSNELNIIIYK